MCAALWSLNFSIHSFCQIVVPVSYEGNLFYPRKFNRKTFHSFLALVSDYESSGDNLNQTIDTEIRRRESLCWFSGDFFTSPAPTSHSWLLHCCFEEKDEEKVESLKKNEMKWRLWRFIIKLYYYSHFPLSRPVVSSLRKFKVAFVFSTAKLFVLFSILPQGIITVSWRISLTFSLTKWKF